MEKCIQQLLNVSIDFLEIRNGTKALNLIPFELGPPGASIQSVPICSPCNVSVRWGDMENEIPWYFLEFGIRGLISKISFLQVFWFSVRKSTFLTLQLWQRTIRTYEKPRRSYRTRGISSDGSS